MTRAGRLCVLAGLIAITAMMSADTSAQECPEWLSWACPDIASSSAPAKNGLRQGKQRARPEATATATRPKPRQAPAPEAARRSAKPTRPTTSGNPSGDRRLVRPGERQGTPLEPEIGDQEREVLFQQFLEWERQTRLNGETDR
jgi:hypothetical protein